MGVNDRVDLARVDRVMRMRLTEELMRAGVTVRDPERLFMEPGVAVGRDSELGPGVELRGKTVVGAGCRIDAGCVLTDLVVGDRVHIKPYCVASESSIGDGAQVGPWAHIRPGSVLEADVHLGNFVETKKTRMRKGAKANHLSYLGDADVGAKANVGCGTITCNYDGYRKSRTVIGDGAFIGSDTQLVAPVTVGAGAVTAAGTTVYRDVPPGALALTRPELVLVDGWAERKRHKMQALTAGRVDPSKNGSHARARAVATVDKRKPKSAKKSANKPLKPAASKPPKRAAKGKPTRRRG
jgi:bifunctional UDP-N-acetylglucosamine pyrophosphorylase/glucosamine-1-phosphate N-acetyltransferase